MSVLHGHYLYALVNNPVTRWLLHQLYCSVDFIKNYIGYIFWGFIIPILRSAILFCDVRKILHITCTSRSIQKSAINHKSSYWVVMKYHMQFQLHACTSIYMSTSKRLVVPGYSFSYFKCSLFTV